MNKKDIGQMSRREIREERNRQDEIRREKRIKRNWILAALSLGAYLFFYFLLGDNIN